MAFEELEFGSEPLGVPYGAFFFQRPRGCDCAIDVALELAPLIVSWTFPCSLVCVRVDTALIPRFDCRNGYTEGDSELGEVRSRTDVFERPRTNRLD